MSRRLLLAAALVVACGGDAAAPTPPPQQSPQSATVVMAPSAFIPFTVTIAVGGTITYEFPAGIQHNVIFPKRPNGQPLVAGAPADILPTQNVKVTRTFGTAGTFAYDCTIHPGMSGEIVVVP